MTRWPARLTQAYSCSSGFRGRIPYAKPIIFWTVLGFGFFPDADSKMNRNIQEAGGSLLVVSQFTLYADCRKGRRPSFDQAAPRSRPQALYEYFLSPRARGPVPVQTGEFQAMMEVTCE